MKKKIFYLIFMLLLLFSLGSCNKNEPAQNNNNNNNNNNNTTPDPNGGNSGGSSQAKEEKPMLPDDYYTNLIDTSSAYKFEIAKLAFPTDFKKITDSVTVEDSFVEFNLTEDCDFEVYGEINYKVYKTLMLSQNKHAKFYVINTDAYYVLTDLITNTTSYAYKDILEIDDVKPFVNTLNAELTKYFNLNISSILINKEIKENIVSNIEKYFAEVLKVVLKYEIGDEITATLNTDALKALNDKLYTEPAATTIDSIFGPFTFLSLKNLLCGTVSKSIFDYKLSDISLAEQYSALSLDNIVEDINTYLPKINGFLGEKKLPFNSVDELMAIVAEKFEIELEEGTTLEDFLQLEELTNLTINNIVDKFVGEHIDLKDTANKIFDLCYKYSFYQLINALSKCKRIDELPTVIATAGDVGFKGMVDAVISFIDNINLTVLTDNEGNLTKATLKFVPDGFIIDFDIELTKTTFESKSEFKALVLANA